MTGAGHCVPQAFEGLVEPSPAGSSRGESVCDLAS